MNPPLLSLQNSPSLPSSKERTLFISVSKTILHATLHASTADWSIQFLPRFDNKREDLVILYVALRPGLMEFLHVAKKQGIQIVMFSKMKRHIYHRLNIIDPAKEIINCRMFYDCCPENGKGESVIDLNLTGRMMDRSVIIDSDPNLHVKPWCNAIKLSPFTGNANDRELWSLISFFKAQRGFVDVRHLLHVCSKPSPLRSLPLPPTSRKTLFLDMDETLISHVPLKGKQPHQQYDFATHTGYVIKRPGVGKLLQMATDHDYEIVIFTAGCRDYASPIIDKLDPDGLITHRLYRDSCKRSKEGKPLKDLSSTGRSLDRCLIVDDMWHRVVQTENVVRIKPFKGDMQDSELATLLLFFSIEKRYENIRDAVSHMNMRLSDLH